MADISFAGSFVFVVVVTMDALLMLVDAFSSSASAHSSIVEHLRFRMASQPSKQSRETSTTLYGIDNITMIPSARFSDAELSWEYENKISLAASNSVLMIILYK
jgi:hypothetical protein